MAGSVPGLASPRREVASRRRQQHLLVFSVTLATRLPFVLTAAGVGSDADAWRMRLAGQMFATTGRYHTSRAPSYPAVELLSTALAGLPDRFLLLLTAVAGALAVTAFADLLRTLDVRGWLPLTVAFAMTPVVFRSDLTFMDYAWASAGTMLCLALLARSRPWGTGALLGLAVASRPAAVTAVIVVAMVLVIERRRVGHWARIAVAAITVVVPFYLLPLVTIGPGVFGFADTSVNWSVAAARMSTGVWGWAGAIAIVAASVIALARVSHVRRELPQVQRTWVVACSAGAAAQLVIFARLPVDPGYLLPLVPLVLLVLGTASSRRVNIGLAAALAVSSLVAPVSSPAFGTSVPQDLEERRASQTYSALAAAALQRLPANAVIIAGSDMPELLAFYPGSVARSPEAEWSREGVPYRVTWPNRVVVIYSLRHLARPPTGPVYRTPQGEPDTVPLLPVSS